MVGVWDGGGLGMVVGYRGGGSPGWWRSRGGWWGSSG